MFLAHHICYSYSWLEYVDFCGLFVLFWCASFFIVIADRTMWIWRRWSIIMWNRVVSVWDGTHISLPCLPVNNPVWGFSSFCHTHGQSYCECYWNCECEFKVFRTVPKTYSFRKPHIHTTLICFQARIVLAMQNSRSFYVYSTATTAGGECSAKFH